MKTVNKKQAYIEAEKREYTVKLTTIGKIILVVVLMGSTYVLGWNNRSDFANEVKGEVQTQLSAVQAVK